MSDSLITKRAIATSIKELMRKKNFQKISVSDVVQNCGINRQTFYYHFKDKYDLVNWIYYDEVVAVIRSKRFDDWNEIVLAILTSMNREQHFYKNVLNNIEQNTLQNDFFDVTKKIITERMDAFAKDKELDRKDKDFVADFYAYGLVGIIVQWAHHEMKESPEQMVRRMQYFIKDNSKILGEESQRMTEPKSMALNFLIK